MDISTNTLILAMIFGVTVVLVAMARRKDDSAILALFIIVCFGLCHSGNCGNCGEGLSKEDQKSSTQTGH
jgi:hypothetical protein